MLAHGEQKTNTGGNHLTMRVGRKTEGYSEFERVPPEIFPLTHRKLTDKIRIERKKGFKQTKTDHYTPTLRRGRRVLT